MKSSLKLIFLLSKKYDLPHDIAYILWYFVKEKSAILILQRWFTYLYITRNQFLNSPTPDERAILRMAFVGPANFDMVIFHYFDPQDTYVANVFKRLAYDARLLQFPLVDSNDHCSFYTSNGLFRNRIHDWLSYLDHGLFCHPSICKTCKTQRDYRILIGRETYSCRYCNSCNNWKSSLGSFITLSRRFAFEINDSEVAQGIHGEMFRSLRFNILKGIFCPLQVQTSKDNPQYSKIRWTREIERSIGRLQRAPTANCLLN